MTNTAGNCPRVSLTISRDFTNVGTKTQSVVDGFAALLPVTIVDDRDKEKLS